MCGIDPCNFLTIQTYSVATFIFCPIQSGVQVREKFVDGVAISHGSNANTDGNGDIAHPSGYGSVGNLHTHLFKEFIGCIFTGIRRDHKKFITADPPEMVVIAETGFQQTRIPAEHFIADHVTVGVIYRLEIIDIAKAH